jgi:hypothetical protein
MEEDYLNIAIENIREDIVLLRDKRLRCLARKSALLNALKGVNSEIDGLESKMLQLSRLPEKLIKEQGR